MVCARKASSCCHKYALVFMDINMPIMDGATATTILKTKMSKAELEYAPIVAVTAARCETDSDRRHYLDLGFDDFGTTIGALTMCSGEAVHCQQVLADSEKVCHFQVIVLYIISPAHKTHIHFTIILHCKLL